MCLCAAKFFSVSISPTPTHSHTLVAHSLNFPAQATYNTIQKVVLTARSDQSRDDTIGSPTHQVTNLMAKKKFF